MTGRAVIGRAGAVPDPGPDQVPGLRLGGFRFGNGGVERLAIRRSDGGWLADRWADQASRVLVVRDGQVPVRSAGQGTELVFVSPALAPEGERFLLGTDQGEVTYFGVGAGPAGPEPAGDAGPERWAGLRELGLAVPEGQAALLTQAVALANWHARARFCPGCGSPTAPEEAGYSRRCLAEGTQIFPRSDPAVIMAVIDPDDRCLLARNVNWPPGRVSVLAGFVEPGESAEQAVVREVLEEVGAAVTAVTYASSQPWPMPHNLMLGFTARAASAELAPDGAEIAEAAWYTRADLTAAIGRRDLLVPPSVSISRWLIETWYGGPLPRPPRSG